MKNILFACRFSILAFAVSLVLTGSSAYAETLSDNFDAGSLNDSLWLPVVVGDGSVSQVNGRLEAIIPSADTSAAFITGIRLQRIIEGDFDITVDYELIDPLPLDEGEPIAGIALGKFLKDALFVGRSVDDDATPRTDAYVGEVGKGEFTAATSDLSGSLRFIRLNGWMATLYRGSSETEWHWIPSIAYYAEHIPLLTIVIACAGSTTINAAFDNFHIEADQILPFPETVHSSDYFAIEPEVICSRTYVGEVRTGTVSWEPIQSKNAMLGKVTVPYVSDNVIGNAGCLLDNFAAYTYEDYQLKTVMDGNYYQSSGCGFASPPPGISYLTDGEMLLEMDYAKFLRGNPVDCMEGGGNEFLIKIQDVTVGGTLYQKALVLWELSDFQCGEAGQPPCDSYIAPAFHSKYAEWGLNLPTPSEQADMLEIGKIGHGAALILGKGEGRIAAVGFSLEKNSLDEFVLNPVFYSELVSISCTEPEISLIDVPGSGFVVPELCTR